MTKIPRDVAANFGGTQKFRAHHRRWLKRASKALAEARLGSAFSPAFLHVRQAQRALDKAIEATRVKNWEGRKRA